MAVLYSVGGAPGGASTPACSAPPIQTAVSLGRDGRVQEPGAGELGEPGAEADEQWLGCIGVGRGDDRPRPGGVDRRGSGR